MVTSLEETIVIFEAIQKHFGDAVICDECGGTAGNAAEVCRAGLKECQGRTAIFDHMATVVAARRAERAARGRGLV